MRGKAVTVLVIVGDHYVHLPPPSDGGEVFGGFDATLEDHEIEDAARAVFEKAMISVREMLGLKKRPWWRRFF